jgi:hypothetical protein
LCTAGSGSGCCPGRNFHAVPSKAYVSGSARLPCLVIDPLKRKSFDTASDLAERWKRFSACLAEMMHSR